MWQAPIAFASRCSTGPTCRDKHCRSDSSIATISCCSSPKARAKDRSGSSSYPKSNIEPADRAIRKRPSILLPSLFRCFWLLSTGCPTSIDRSPSALDSPRVRGKQFEAIVKLLGCKRFKYIGVGRSKPPPPPAWEWPKYRRSGEDELPAFLSVEKNNTEGYAPHFDDRPKGHKMLCVDVTESQRSACIRELSKALGEGAELL